MCDLLQQKKENVIKEEDQWKKIALISEMHVRFGENNLAL